MKDSQLLKKKTKKFKKGKQNNTPDLPPSASSVKVITDSKSFFDKFKLPPLSIPKLPMVSTMQRRKINLYIERYESDFQLILFPLILLIVLITLNVINTRMYNSLASQELPYSHLDTRLNPYPFVQAVTNPVLSAKAAIIVDRNSQVILFAKNPELRFSMASTTKIMTALTGLDYYKLDDILTIKKSAVEGSGLGFAPGEKFKFIDLLYAMMLPSANDAAQAIADNYPGGESAFVARMNQKAASLHLLNTHYADPAGLNDDGDYTTVVDLSRLASYAITNLTFVDVTSTRTKTITDISMNKQYPLTNLNKLLGSQGVTGIKTGTTEGAGEVLVTSTVKNGHTYIIVVMQSTDRFSDTAALLKFIDTNVQYIQPTPGYNY